jgi:predicted metal-dependent hydrolase
MRDTSFVVAPILINWHLIFAPRKVLEYVVAHEVAHLSIRSHGPSFWRLVGTIMPGFDDAKGWLEKHQGDLSSEFLEIS